MRKGQAWWYAARWHAADAGELQLHNSSFLLDPLMEQTTNYRVVIALSMAFLVALLVLGALTFWISWSKASSKDVDDAQVAGSALTFPFPKHENPNFGGAPSMYVRPNPRRTEFIIYGVLDREQQDLIVAQLRAGQAKLPRKPVVVTFLEREVWSGSPGGYSRGKERTVRQETIGK
ncbi:MAG TPA: hypothetical protein VFF82_04875 [Rhodocyclaceae bacterium]|nr:hypothetical protein [Rhodocyclaceae bacterium]